MIDFYVINTLFLLLIKNVIIIDESEIEKKSYQTILIKFVKRI